MAAVQLSFALRTSSNVKTVHLVGNWDGYKGQLPLSKDSSKSGSWKGNFRFQAATLKAGQRYWYYYIMDGYHVSHDPAKPATLEPTTGRQLNILDVPKSSSGHSSSSSKSHSSSSAPLKPLSFQTQRQQGLGIEIPTGRGISPSRIISPKPSKPYASRGIREADYSRSPVDELSSTLAGTSLYDYDYPSSPSSGSSLSRSSSGGSSPSSLSSLSDRSASSCRCNRFGITRRGDKVRLDCGGSRCGYSDDSSSCCSDSDDEPQRSSRRAPARANVQTIKPKSYTTQEIKPRKQSAATTTSRRR